MNYQHRDSEYANILCNCSHIRHFHAYHHAYPDTGFTVIDGNIHLANKPGAPEQFAEAATETPRRELP